MSILTQIYYRSTNIYAIKLFLPIYDSLISVRWTNDKIRFLGYYFPLVKICAKWDSLCNHLLLLYKILVFDFIEAIKLEVLSGLKILIFGFLSELMK